MRIYLPEPDMVVGEKMPDREFFLGIMSTLKEEEMKHLLDDSLKKRFQGGNDPEHKNVIIVDE